MQRAAIHSSGRLGRFVVKLKRMPEQVCFGLMLPGFVFFAVTAATGKQTSTKDQPEWISKLPQSLDLYIIGRGASDRSYNDAEDDARAEIARTLEVEITSAISISVGEIVRTRKVGDVTIDTNIYTGVFHEATQSFVRKRLKGVRITETWYDEKTLTFWALAVIENIAVQQQIEEEIQLVSGRAMQFFMRARAYLEQGQISSAIRSLLSGLDAFQLLSGRKVSAEIDGRKEEDIELTMLIFLQNILDNIQLSPVSKIENLIVGAKEIPLTVRLYYSGVAGILQPNLEKLPLKFVFKTGNGQLQERAMTISQGIGPGMLFKVTSIGQARIDVSLDFEAYLETDADQTAMERYYKFHLPQAQFTFSTELPKVAIEITARDARYTSDSAVIRDILAERLTEQGYQVVELGQQVDLLLRGRVSVIRLPSNPYGKDSGLIFLRATLTLEIIDVYGKQSLRSVNLEKNEAGLTEEQAIGRALKAVAHEVDADFFR